MNKKELIAEMKQFSGGSFITRKALSDFLALSDPKSVDRYINGLPRLNQRYFIGDVVDRMLEECEYRG